MLASSIAAGSAASSLRITLMDDQKVEQIAALRFIHHGKNEFDRLCGVSDWVIHDLRRTFATKIAEWQLEHFPRDAGQHA